MREFFFLTTKIKYIYSTTPDLNKSLFKRSKLSKNKYIYLQHSPLSLTKAYNHEAFHYFDAIQAIHNFHVEEIKSFKKNNIKIRYFKSNYKIIDSIKTKDSNNEQLYDLMIAPSWSTDFYNANFFKLIKKLNKEKITFFLRPHPMSIKKKEFSYSFLNKNKIKIDTSPKLDFSKSKNIISDYSGIFIEFMIKTGKKPLLINSREKILNNSVVPNKTFEQVIRENLCNPINYTNVSDYDFRNKLKNEEFINKNDILKYFY